jgi:ABC-type transporter Mla subunit MlaD
MNERRRNLAVGITVIASLALLAGMILIFTGFPQWFAGGYVVRIEASSTLDAQPGDTVHLAGMPVGNVTSVQFANPDIPSQGVTIAMKIDGGVPLPANTKAYFYSRGVTGQTYIELKASSPLPRGPGGEVRYLSRDGTAVIEAERRGSSLIPDELSDAIDSFGKLAENINQLFEPPPQPQTGTGTDTAPTTDRAPTSLQSMQGVLVQLGTTLEGLNEILGDPESRQNIKQSLSNLAQATAEANEAMAALKAFATEARQTTTQATATVENFSELAQVSRRKLDQLSDKLIEDAEQLSDVLATTNRLMTKIEQGEGTAGQFINDRQLYNNLIQATEQLNQTLREFRDLARGWREEGVPIKVR